ncbi:MAG: hypothetical protein ACK40G_02615 [Cytophagaceae bacterium]
MRYLFSLIFLLVNISLINAQEDTRIPRLGLGVNTSLNYSFSGVSTISTLEYQKGHHIVFAGLKIPLSQTYMALRSPFGYAIGYRHETQRPAKRTNFLFTVEYHIVTAKAYSRYEQSRKRNHIHEFFLGYGIQFRLFDQVYFGNIMGIGGYIQSLYNVDLDLRHRYYNYNNILKIYLNYRL